MSATSFGSFLLSLKPTRVYTPLRKHWVIGIDPLDDPRERHLVSGSGNESWRSIHEAACRSGALAYTDPETGYRVFTATALSRREQCCGSGCRHCPFGHVRVAPGYRAHIVCEPWFEGSMSSTAPHSVVFWSGGKDSFLALRRVIHAQGRNVLLVTTFDGQTEIVAHQDIHINVIREQARALNLPLLLVPLYPDTEYARALQTACTVIERQVRIKCVVFGDLHLLHVRHWRETTFAQVESVDSVTVSFPLWHAPYSTLLHELEISAVVCVISAVTDERLKPFIKVGMRFDRALVATLPEGVDRFGECGAFHTVIESKSLTKI